MKQTIIGIIVLVVGVALAIGLYINSNLYFASQARELVREFAPAIDTLSPTDQNKPTELPENMPEDVRMTFVARGDMLGNETTIIISIKASTIIRESRFGGDEFQTRKWDLKLSEEEVEKMYGVFRTRSFDTIRTIAFDEIIADMGEQIVSIEYTKDGEEVRHMVNSGATEGILEEDSDRWLDFIHLFYGIASKYPQ